MWIKTFSSHNQHYLYATESNEIFQIDADLFEYFNSSAQDEDKYQIASDLGMVSTTKPHIGIYEKGLIADGLEKIKREGSGHLALSITEACNFRCKYCAYSGNYEYSREHSSKSMSAETVYEAIDWYFGFKRKNYHIGFYGGEPLLKHKLLKNLVGYARQHLPAGSKLGFGMTTNGWLLNDNIAHFLADNNIELFISLDGSEEQHDRYRVTQKQQPSFSTIWKNIQNLRLNYPDYYQDYVNFSITLVPPNSLEDVQAFIQKNPETFKGKVPKLGSINSATSKLTEQLGIDTCWVDTNKMRSSYLKQMVKRGSADDLSRASNEAIFRNFHNRPMGEAQEMVSSGGQCMPGMRCHVSADGKLHMCEHGDEHWPIGDVESGLYYPRIDEILKEFHQQIQSRCENFWATRLCKKCIPQLAEGPGLSKTRLNSLCQSRQRSLKQDLIDYCEAREQNPHCFDELSFDGLTENSL